jgi:hypothetical protein
MALSLIAGLTACNDGSSGPGAQTVNLNFRSAGSTAAANVSADVASGPSVQKGAAELVVTSGDDELVITSAQIVLRNVKLQPSAESCPDETNGEDDTEGEAADDDSCATMFVGPLLIDIPTDNTAGSEISVLIPEGSYRSVQLRVHKVSSNRPDEAAFRAANPGFQDASVKVVGTYNGLPFTFSSDVTAVVNLPLPEPITVGGEEQDLTVELDVSKWFLGANGTLLSPLLDNNQVKQLIRSNIRTSIRAFRDNNGDGEED